MKKQIFLAASLFALLLTGCNKTSQNPIPSSGWGSNVDTYTYTKMNENLMPFVQSDSYEVEMGDDAFGDPTVTIYCYYSDEASADEAETSYQNACAALGFDVVSGPSWGISEDGYYFQYNTNFADKSIDDHLGLEIQFLVSVKNEKDCLGIFAYVYIDEEEDVYPQIAVEHFLTNGGAAIVPQIDEEGLTYDFLFDTDDDGIPYLTIEVSGVEYGYEEEYFNLCYDSEFMMADNEFEDFIYEYPGYGEREYYYAISYRYSFAIAFYFSEDYYVFVIQIFMLQDD